jgi:hypothetical protein
MYDIFTDKNLFNEIVPKLQRDVGILFEPFKYERYSALNKESARTAL